MADDTYANRWSYDSRRALESCSLPGLHRQIGVLASRPFHHVGLNAEYVDIQREAAVVSTQTWGNCYPAETFVDELAQATSSTIDDLERVIDELARHRDRLKVELEMLNEATLETLLSMPTIASEPDARSMLSVMTVELPAA